MSFRCEYTNCSSPVWEASCYVGHEAAPHSRVPRHMLDEQHFEKMTHMVVSEIGVPSLGVPVSPKPEAESPKP